MACAAVAIASPTTAVFADISPVPTNLTGWNYTVGRDGVWQRDVADPSQHVVADGDVLGWTYAPMSAPAASPSTSAVYSNLCPAESRQSSAGPRVRVAVVVDSAIGTAEGKEPLAIQCIVVSRGTHANDALSQAGNAVRFDGVILCAINDIPAEGCLDAASPLTTASAPPTQNAASTDANADQHRSPTTTVGTTASAVAAIPGNSAAPSDNETNAVTQTPRAWLLSGGLLFLAVGLLAASKRRTASQS